MISENKRKRNIQKYYDFFWACFVSLTGLIIYLLGKRFIPFPHYWLSGCNDSILLREEKLFLFGISIYSLINWFLSYFFYFLNFNQKLDYIKVRKWKYLANKILVFFFTLIATWGKYWSYLKGWSDFFLLGIITIVINCCLIDLLVNLMNQHGVCNAFNLIFFTEYLPTNWIKKNDNRDFFQLFHFFFITVCFIWVTNIKWEMPIETNVLPRYNNSLSKKKSTQFGLKLNLSFMNFYQLSWLISLFHEFKMINDEYGDTLNWWNKMKKLLIKGEKLRETIKKRTSNNKSFWDTFFFLNKKRDFFYYHSKLGFRSQSIKFLNPTLLLIFLHGLNNWLQITYVQWNAREISKDLKKKGIYFNNVAYGPATRRFLKKKINNLVFFWYLIVLFFCFLFSDNRISDLNFIDWFSSINLGTNLIQQIRTKYKYLEIK